MTGAPRLAVLGDVGRLGAAADWYRDVSGGAALLDPVVLPVGEPPQGWAAYAPRGGMGPAPANSQALVADLLAGLSAADRAVVATTAVGAGARVVVAVPPDAGFAPHTWRLRRGGSWLGGRAWARRYAVLASDAPLGTVAHELGHLLFDWQDHARREGLGADCLMGTGGGADPPAPPCAAERLATGWAVPAPATRATRVADLADGHVARLGLDGPDELVAALGTSGDVLVFWGGALAARVPAASATPDRPLLSVIPAMLLG